MVDMPEAEGNFAAIAGEMQSSMLFYINGTAWNYNLNWMVVSRMLILSDALSLILLLVFPASVHVWWNSRQVYHLMAYQEIVVCVVITKYLHQ